MRSRACGGPVRNWVGDGTAMAQGGLRRAAAGSGALRGATLLTYADSVRRGSSTAVIAPGKGQLMRFGFAPIRGSNPRASAAHRPSPGTQGEGLAGFWVHPVAVWVAVASVLTPQRLIRALTRVLHLELQLAATASRPSDYSKDPGAYEENGEE